MRECPYCQSTERQIKDGRNRSGSRRFKCNACGRGYTPDPARNGYPEEVRASAVRLHLGGYNLRHAGHALDVSHQSILNLVKVHFPHPADRGTAALLQGQIEVGFEDLSALVELDGDERAAGPIETSVRKDYIDGFVKRLGQRPR